MDVVFSNQIKWNLEVYIDDMIMKIPKEKIHCKNLENILSLF